MFFKRMHWNASAQKSDFQVALEGAVAGSLRLHVNSEFQGREGHMPLTHLCGSLGQGGSRCKWVLSCLRKGTLDSIVGVYILTWEFYGDIKMKRKQLFDI